MIRRYLDATFELPTHPQRVDLAHPYRPCGCGVKLDVDGIVAPTLARLETEDERTRSFGAARRRDAFVSRRAPHFLTRALNSAAAPWCELPRRSGGALAVVELTSLGAHADLQAKFHALQAEKFMRLSELTPGLSFAKGHSIEAGLDFTVLDFFSLGETQDSYFALNNDTIVTCDSVLHPHAWESVFTSFNNALNDLFVGGATDELELWPVYDGPAEALPIFRAHFDDYARSMREFGVEITLHPTRPLGIGAHLIGATVKGAGPVAPSTFAGLRPGDDIIITEELGDLALLSAHRMAWRAGQVSPELRAFRELVLRRFTTPRYSLAKLAQRFRPRFGESTRPDKHLSFISDLSGPGLKVLREAAQLSGQTVLLEDIEYIDPLVFSGPRKNYTSSTNGGWVMAGAPELVRQVLAELRALGFASSRKIGRVLGPSEGQLHFSPELQERFRAHPAALAF